VASEEKQTTTAVTLRRGRLPIVLASFAVVILGSFALLGVSLVGGFTGIDRSDPRVVVSRFLQAIMVDHNAAVAQTFMCDAWQANDAMRQLKYTDDPEVVTTFGVISVSANGNSAQAAVELNFTFEKQNDFQYWRISLVKQTDGWRACSAVMDPSLAPK
jgi:nitrate reductase NapE component